MIAYLDKYDTTVELPDDISDKDLQDVNQNFHHYVDTNPVAGVPTPAPATQPSQETAQPQPTTAPEPEQKWKPNFYEAALSQTLAPLKAIGEATQSPEAMAFAGKAAEELSFGAAKPLLEPVIGQAVKDHPAFADAGAITGGVGSLMEAGGALRIAGLAAPAAAAGSAAVETGFAAGERFIPRAIMTGATFGTRTFIAETVKHFEEGGVNLEQFGKDVLKDTAFGGIFGTIGGLSNAVSSVSSAGALGFISSKMSGSDNREASLNAAIWAAFETVGSAGKSESLRLEALGHLKDSIGEYIGERNPEMRGKAADQAASAFVDRTITKAGFDNAEDIAKSGPENLLEGIEKVNQMVRTARVPAEPGEQAPLLPKLPAPIEPETAVTPQAPEPTPKTPIEKAIDTVKSMMGIKSEEPAEPKPPTVTGDTYEEKVQSLKDQGHDISTMPESAFPEDMKDVYHFEQGKQLKQGVSKAISEISDRLTTFGVNDDEQNAILSHYGLDKVGQLGQAVIPTETFKFPIEDQYKQAYSVLAAERGIPYGEPVSDQRWKEWQEILKTGIKPPMDDMKDEYGQLPLARKNSSGRGIDEIAQEAREKGLLGENEDPWVKIRSLKAPGSKVEKFDSLTMDDAEKAVDLINGYFSPKSQEIKDFVTQHGEASDHDIAQMAYDRGMIESPNPDLLKAEVQKAKQEKPIIHAMVAYHGTPHKFDKFDIGKIGTGEGAQSYGWGLYFSGNKDVADYYRQKLSAQMVQAMPELKEYFKPGRIVKSYDGYDRVIAFHENGSRAWGGWDVDVRKVKKVGGEWVDNGPIRNHATAPTMKDVQETTGIEGGKLHTVDIPEQNEYLDWDKPFYQQPQTVKNAINALKIPNMGDTGKEIYNNLVSWFAQGHGPLPEEARNRLENSYNPKKAASIYLSKAGVPGITYLDQLSRGAGNGTSNYVVFDDKLIKPENKPITHAQMAPGATMPRPTIKTPEVVAHIQQSANEITTVVNPTKAAPLAAQITREQLGKMARSYDMAEAALSDAKDLFEKQPNEKNLDFIDRMERGQEQKTPELNEIAQTLRKLIDDKRSEIQALGTGKLKSFIENYFPHIWDQGEKEVGTAVRNAAKRPLEGSKGFLKKRSIEFTSDGIKMGLTPVSYNPVDLVLLKIREMDKYIMAHRTISEFKQEGLAQYVKVGDDAPEGWTKIDDRISTIFKSPMVAVKEAFDAKVMSELNQIAENLGIDLERSQRMKGEGQQFKEAWGLSQSYTEGKPGKIWTKFAGPESALAHEIGHQVDHIYGFQDKFLSDPKIDKELTELANERVPEGSKQSFKDYVQQPGEKMAAMMEAYIHAPDLLKETAPTAFAKLTKIIKSDPNLAPLAEIKPSLQLGVSEGQVYAGGNVIAGHIYAQADAARIINNYLSPGLQKYSIYKAYRYAGNLTNQFQLSLSAFHLGFTTVDSIVSKFALGLNELAAGNPIKAVSNILASPFSPITTLIKGDNLLKAWRGQGQNGSDTALAEAMAIGGGRSRMDQFYAVKASEQMKHYFDTGKYVKGIFSIPFSLLDISSRPILEYIVPRMKLGMISDLLRMEMQNNPNMTHSQLREIAGRAVDSADNRLGQMIYDNLFWNRTFKDLLMASMRSVGWNIGTMRELVGGARDYAEAVKDSVQGKKTEFTYRMAYLTALPIIVGALGAMMQYIRTGKGPQEAKDYFFPKTGGVDEHGDPHRIALPSYMKDIYHYSQAPVTTVLNKLNPVIAMISQMFQNKDYYGTKIRNEDDPLVKQVMSEAGFIAKQAIPFSIRNMMKNQETGNKSLFDTVGPWVGITPAPYDIDQTKAEKLAHEISMSHQEIGGRTEEQMERSRLVSDLTRRYKMGDPKAMDDIYKAYEMGAISHRQMTQVISNSSLTPLQRSVKNMTLEETERVYAKASDEEKGQIESMLDRKRANHEREFVAQ